MKISKLASTVSAFLILLILTISCGNANTKAPENEVINSNSTAAAAARETIRVITYDSFNISEEVLDDFEARQNIKIEILTSPDTGSMVAQLILTRDNPIADVVFGIDNTFLQRALDEQLFLSYESPGLENVSSEFLAGSFVTPVQYGDVCINYWRDSFAEGNPNTSSNPEATKPPAPSGLEDLTEPLYKNQLVTQNPETSSPGLAFLLATIAKYGEDGWQDYWRQLRQNGIAVTSGWTEAYYTDFKAGGGERSIVTSYASSPAAGVYYSERELTTSPTAVIKDGCFRQVEYAGILAGTSKPDAAQKVMDLFLSKPFQEAVPLNMFVYPVNQQAKLPQLFIDHSPVIQNPVSLSPELIAQKRDDWTRQWVEIVLR